MRKPLVARFAARPRSLLPDLAPGNAPVPPSPARSTFRCPIRSTARPAARTRSRSGSPTAAPPQRPYTATFLDAESDGTQRSSTPPPQTAVAAGRTSILGGVSTPGKNGLLEINASATMSIEARLYSTSADAQTTTVSPVPVISSDNLFAAGTTAVVLGLRRDLTHGDVTSLGVVNLGQQAAQCQVNFFRADGSQIGATAIPDLQAALAALLRRRLRPAQRAADGGRARPGELRSAVLHLRDDLHRDQLAD